MGGEGLLEGGDLGPEHVGRALGDFLQGLEDLVLAAPRTGPSGPGTGPEARASAAGLRDHGDVRRDQCHA